MKWISVKKEMPEDLVNVLGYCPNVPESGSRIETVFFIEERKEWAGQPLYFTNYITHWMTLPKEPSSPKSEGV